MHFIPKRPPTALQRQAAARAAREARTEAWNDPVESAKRRVRSALMALASLGDDAARIWHRENDSQQAPRGAGSGLIHPQRAARIAEIMTDEGWSDDPAAPIRPSRTVEYIVQELDKNARAELDAANADFAKIEAERKASAAIDPAPLIVTSPVAAREAHDAADHIPRGRGRPPRALAEKLSAEGVNVAG